MVSWHDKVIERGTVSLLVFAPFAFAGVTVWADSIIQIAAFCIFLVWLMKAASGESIVLYQVPIIVLWGGFACLALLQLLPLPPGLLEAISRGSAAMYRGAPGIPEDRWHPVSVYPQETLQELLNVLAYLAMFIVVLHHFRRRKQILLLVRTIVITGCVLVVVALLQKATWNGRLYWFYPIDPAYSERLMYIWGPYLNRNHFAGFLEMTIPLALGLLVYFMMRSRADRGKTIVSQIAALAGHGRLGAVSLCLLAVTVLSGALFATLSRGAVLGFAVSATVFVLLARSRRSLRGKASVLLLAGVIVFVVGIFASWDGIEARFGEIAQDDHIERIYVWSGLPALVSDFPVLGTGLGTFDRAYPRYQRKYATVIFEHAENDYLEVLSDMGVVGLSLMMALAAVFFLTVLRGWKARGNAFSTSLGLGGIASCSAIAVHSLTDFNLRVPANALLLAVIAALTLAALSRHEHVRHTRSARRIRRTIGGHERAAA